MRHIYIMYLQSGECKTRSARQSPSTIVGGMLALAAGIAVLPAQAGRLEPYQTAHEPKERRMILFDYQEPSFYPVVGNAIPHHSGLSERQHVPEPNNLSGVQRWAVVHCPEAALAVVHQAARYVL